MEPKPAIRRHDLPFRVVEGQMLVARPADGEPVLLDSTSSLVWFVATDWIPVSEVAEILGLQFPSIRADRRDRALQEIIVTLTEAELVDRR